MKRIGLILMAILLVAFPVFSISLGFSNNYDVTFYYLRLEPSIDSSYLKGDVLCKFKSTVDNLTEIKLNLISTFEIDSIVGASTSYSFNNDTISVILNKNYQTGEEAEVRIYYKGVPQSSNDNITGYNFSKSFGSPRIVTVSMPYYSQQWWPCKDGPGDKADSVYIDITIPDTIINGVELSAISNGFLENTISEAGKKTFQWRERSSIATYYIMTAVSNYKHIQQLYSGKYGENFPIDYYVFPEYYETVQSFIEPIPEVMDFFSDKFGIYPFHEEKYAMTQMAVRTGLENQTNLVWYYGSWNPDRFNVVVHELAHQWFACMISLKDLHHVWINEGFATYCEALWFEHKEGSSSYRSYMKSLKHFGGGTPYHENIPFKIWDIFNYNVQYKKSAWVLHMLRGVLGDSVFFDCLYQYANHTDLMYNHATTEDFRNVCESASGMELGFFFDQWVFDEFYPKYEYSFQQNPETYETEIQIIQTQSEFERRLVFEMPIQLLIVYQNNSDTLITVWNDKENQTFTLSLNESVKKIIFDPYEWILRTEKYVVTGIEKPTISGLSIYPNPTYTLITIETGSPDHYSINLNSLNGQLIYSTTMEGTSHQIDLSPFQKGVYLITIKSEDFVTSRKVIKL